MGRFTRIFPSKYARGDRNHPAASKDDVSIGRGATARNLATHSDSRAAGRNHARRLAAGRGAAHPRLHRSDAAELRALAAMPSAEENGVARAGDGTAVDRYIDQPFGSDLLALNPPN